MRNKIALFVILVWISIFCTGCTLAVESQANQIIGDFEAVIGEANGYVETEDPNRLMVATELDELEALTERVDTQLKMYTAQMLTLIESYQALEGQIDQDSFDNNLIWMQDNYMVFELLRLLSVLSGKERAWDINVSRANNTFDIWAYCGDFSSDCETIEAEANALGIEETDDELITSSYDFLMEKLEEADELVFYAIMEMDG